MTLTFSRWLAAASLVTCLSTACTTERFAIADQVMRGARSATEVAMMITPSEMRIGERVQVAVRTSQPGYLYLYQLNTDGTLNLVFPNAIDGANYLAAGVTLLPRQDWELIARGPAGVGYLLAVVADQRQDLTQISARARTGRISNEGPYGAALSMLRERQP